MSIIYIVQATYGSHEDTHTQIIGAFTDKWKAEFEMKRHIEHVTRLVAFNEALESLMYAWVIENPGPVGNAEDFDFKEEDHTEWIVRGDEHRFRLCMGMQYDPTLLPRFAENGLWCCIVETKLDQSTYGRW